MNISVDRSHYIHQCKRETADVLKGKYLLKYERDKHGRQVGVVIAYRDTEGRVKIGWSRCHTKLEKFDRHIGINKAISRAKFWKEIDERDAPHPLRPEVSEMLSRAGRYFQLPLVKIYQP